MGKSESFIQREICYVLSIFKKNTDIEQEGEEKEERKRRNRTKESKTEKFIHHVFYKSI